MKYVNITRNDFLCRGGINTTPKRQFQGIKRLVAMITVVTEWCGN